MSGFYPEFKNYPELQTILQKRQGALNSVEHLQDFSTVKSTYYVYGYVFISYHMPIISFVEGEEITTKLFFDYLL